MRLPTTVLTVAVAMGLGWAANDVFSQDEGGGMDPDLQRKWMEFMTPGAPHQELNEKVGTWTGEATMYEGGMEMKSPGTYERKMIFGRRYMIEDVRGSWGGMPFQGKSIVGYDNHRKEYFNIWFDSFGTSFMLFRGNKDEAGALHMKTELQEDFTGNVSAYRTVTTFKDDGSEYFEMFRVDAEGNETKAMEHTLARKGAEKPAGEGTEPGTEKGE